jgi:hypothetical protein
LSNQFTAAAPVSAAPVAPNSPTLLKIPDAARLLGLTPWQLRAVIATGELPILRIGKRIYVRAAALARWAERAEDRYRVQRMPRRKKVGAS